MSAGIQKTMGAPAKNLVKVVKGTTNVEGNTALLVGIAGTANLTDIGGTVHTDVPLQLGYNPLRIKTIEAGGTADDIWALYI